MWNIVFVGRCSALRRAGAAFSTKKQSAVKNKYSLHGILRIVKTENAAPLQINHAVKCLCTFGVINEITCIPVHSCSADSSVGR